MSEEDRPVPPTDDYAIAALIKHWQVQKSPQVHMVCLTDSLIFTEPGFAGAVITSRPPPPPDPNELLPTLVISSFPEKLYNRCSAHSTPVAPAAPLRHRAFLASAPAAGAPLDPR